MMGFILKKRAKLKLYKDSDRAIQYLDPALEPGAVRIVRRGRVRVVKAVPAKRLEAYTIGQRVRKYRLVRGMTQIELAEEAQVARPNIARLEAGRHSPTSELLRRIAAALHVDLAQLRESPSRVSSKEEQELSEGGIGQWGDLLDKEDHRK